MKIYMTQSSVGTWVFREEAHLEFDPGPVFGKKLPKTRFNFSILLLLIIGGIEVNPGPSSSLNLTFGLLNTRSVVNKAPLLHCLIADNDLSFLALTET